MKDLVDMVNDNAPKGKRKNTKQLNGPVPLTKDLVLTIEDIITSKQTIKDLNDGLKDTVKSLAEKMQVTTGEMNSMIANIIAARENESKMGEKQKSIDFVDTFSTFKKENF